MNFIWPLAGLTVVLAIILVALLVMYFRGAKPKDELEEDGDNPAAVPSKKTPFQGKVDVSQCLDELKQQKDIIKQLIVDCDPADKKRMTLFECWALFLDVEYSLVSTKSFDKSVDAALEQFLPLTEDVGFAQEMDGMVKKIAAQKKLSKNMTKEIERKANSLEAKTLFTDKLNDKLEALRKELSEEEEIDKFLLDARLELTSLWQLENRLQEQLEDMKAQNQEASDYQEAVQAFLDDTELGDFVAPIHDEYQGKVQQLKTVADYQKSIIQELKREVQAAKENKADGANIEYDVVLARLEKTFQDKKTILHKLEDKLDSLQVIQHNLTLDVEKHDVMLAAKDAELKQQEQSDSNLQTMQSILEQQQDSVRNIEGLLDQAPLIQESEQLVQEQSSKIQQIKKMIDESELFVEVLEQDLDKEQKEQEGLQLKLSELSEALANAIPSGMNADNVDIDKLKQQNSELEAEIQSMEKALAEQSDTPSDESLALQEKLDALDEKILKIRDDYAQMEEKYLSALL